jgi:hypothetical protein
MPTRLMQVHEQRSGDKPVLPQPFDFSYQARPSEKTPYAYRRPRREIWEWRDHTPLACLFVAWLPSLRSYFGMVLWTVFDTIVDAVFNAGMIVLPPAFRSNSLRMLLRP